eukprot:Gb_41275 [translate_table: standard]
MGAANEFAWRKDKAFTRQMLWGANPIPTQCLQIRIPLIFISLSFCLWRYTFLTLHQLGLTICLSGFYPRLNYLFIAAYYGSYPTQGFQKCQNFDYDALKNLHKITPTVQNHLKRVYLSLTCALLAYAMGVYLHLLWNIDELVTGIACIISIMRLLFTTPHPSNEGSYPCLTKGVYISWRVIEFRSQYFVMAIVGIQPFWWLVGNLHIGDPISPDVFPILSKEVPMFPPPRPATLLGQSDPC